AFTREMLAGTAWEEMTGEIARLVDRTMGTELIGRAASARRVFREVSFSIPLGRLSPDSGVEGRSGLSGLLEGRIDLLFEDEEGWTVVDYKTDDVRPGSEEERARAYHAQAAAYAIALESMGISPVCGVHLLFAGTGAAVGVDVGGPGLSSVRRRIISAAGLE
ncbi:MAG TPA: PD-(D/E)XK nuclease family protein, partial [Candidatus Krumholzibacterium sp.]|nr:PD-(D/E)XK nuclease family protein [Candidatus Krumholzibacterium sp.]